MRMPREDAPSAEADPLPSLCAAARYARGRDRATGRYRLTATDLAPYPIESIV
jgi:hypothetical protein